MTRPARPPAGARRRCASSRRRPPAGASEQRRGGPTHSRRHTARASAGRDDRSRRRSRLPDGHDRAGELPRRRLERHLLRTVRRQGRVSVGRVSHRRRAHVRRDASKRCPTASTPRCCASRCDGLLSAVRDDPDAGRVLFIEAFAGGPRLREQMKHVLEESERRAELFLDGPPAGSPSLDVPAIALVGAVRSVVARHLRTHSEDLLPSLLDPMLAWMESYSVPPGEIRWSAGEDRAARDRAAAARGCRATRQGGCRAGCPAAGTACRRASSRAASGRGSSTRLRR